MNTIKSIDFLGNKPTLMINKNESHKSIFGGFMSIITILIFLLADVEVIPQLIRLLQQNLVLLQPTPIAAWKNQLVP
jgi:hypothetical protein